MTKVPWFCTPEWHAEAEAKFGKKRRKHNAQWPIESDFMGCYPEQVPEFTAELKKNNVRDVYYKPDGTCVIGNQAAFNKLARTRGQFHKGEGYHVQR